MMDNIRMRNKTMRIEVKKKIFTQMVITYE